MGVKKRKYSKTPILKTFHFIKKLVIIMFIYVHFLRYLSGRGCVGVGGVVGDRVGMDGGGIHRNENLDF